jgi:phthalate 4,5-dioxygenase oxygenase subunit
MLSAQDNELITRVGPGTPMGELMRRHWIPALESSALVADGEPVRLMLLGEKLVAFRDTEGRVGIMDHECPHRCASLFYGRNEEGGLRCIYHGWKFDVEGNCLDMANVPPHQDFKDKIHAKAYKVEERNGMIWTYMGPGAAPALPPIMANMLAEDDVVVMSTMRNCNWLQALEGDIDTSHANFLHGGMFGTLGEKKVPTESPDDPAYYDPLRYGYTETPYEFEGSDTDWGTMYGAFRNVDDNRTYWRLAQFIFPFFVITPTAPTHNRASMSASVPMDDEHVMRFNFNRVGGNLNQQQRKFIPDTTDWYGRSRLLEQIDNDHLIDREAQRSRRSYSGILGGIAPQDTAVTESMGPIANRTKEHLAVSDRMIMITRRRLIDAAVALRDEGKVPLTVSQPSIYATITGGYFLAPKDKNLTEVYRIQRDEFMAHTQDVRAKAAE